METERKVSVNIAGLQETNDPYPNGRRRIKSSFFFQGMREVVIVHEQEEYVLRVTRNGKLILTK
jgi:hemin uptake protein HemP